MGSYAAWLLDQKKHNFTRDDLIRLVVGMQWREAMGHVLAALAMGAEAEPDPSPEELAFLADHYPTASDIVDEWLGAK